MGKFDGNVAHNVEVGLSIYPPRHVSYPITSDDYDTLENFFVWNAYWGYHSVSNNIRMTNFMVIGAHAGMNIDSGNNIVIEESSLQDVCNGVMMAETIWNVLHSGVRVSKVAFHRIWDDSGYHSLRQWDNVDRCAPVLFRVLRSDDFGKVTSQFVNLKLYKVKKFFSFQAIHNAGSITDNAMPHGFYIYNVLSFNSEMKHIAPASNNDTPSYVVRHGYPGNLVDTNNSLVRNCEESTIGGNPVSDQFFVCKEQCWRPIALIFDQVLGNNVPIFLKFVSKSGTFFISDSTKVPEYLCVDNYIHIVQVLPMARYEIFLVDSEMNELSKKLHEQADIRFYYADERYDGFKTNLHNYGCLDSLVLEFNGNNLPSSNFKICGGYWG